MHVKVYFVSILLGLKIIFVLIVIIIGEWSDVRSQFGTTSMNDDDNSEVTKKSSFGRVRWPMSWSSC